MNEQAQHYLERYQEAEPEQKPAIAEEFQTFSNGFLHLRKHPLNHFCKTCGNKSATARRHLIY